MKLLLLVIFVLAPRPFFSQEFKSSATAHSKIQYELEYIDRDIELREDKIIITSKGKEVTDVQELNIQSTEEKVFGKFGLCTWYFCNSKGISGTEKFVIVPIADEPKQIIVIESKTSINSIKEYRIIID